MLRGTDNFKLVTKSGLEFDMFKDFNVLVRSLIIPTASQRYYYDKVENKAGLIPLGRTLDGMNIRAECSVFAGDDLEYERIKGDLSRLFMSGEDIYLTPDRENEKRYLVHLEGDMAFERTGTYGQFTLNLPSPNSYAESVATTGNSPEYTFNTATFSVYNAGDVTIDPRELPFKLTFAGASTNLRIRNLTTGDDWRLTGTTNASQNVVLDGVRATRSGLSIFGATNRKLITIAPGWNDFQITGATGAFTVALDFRFYYFA